jgi:BMFP domain-containing protein YqiC
MTIRAIAMDLYHFQQRVAELEKELDAAPQEAKADIEHQIKKAKAECNRLRRILDGQLDR